MTTHTAHEDVHTHGLADGCPRCAEHAYEPFVSLDETTLRNLVRRVYDGESGRSDYEDMAMINVKQMLDQAAELAALDPVGFAKFVKARRGVSYVTVSSQR